MQADDAIGEIYLDDQRFTVIPLYLCDGQVIKVRG